MDLLGLNVYEEIYDLSSLVSNVVVDEMELNKFIASHSDYLTIEMCEKLQKAEMEYLAKIGIIELDE